jgi:hypothetical protein
MGAKETRAVRGEKGVVKSGRVCEKIPTLNDNPTRHISQTCKHSKTSNNTDMKNTRRNTEGYRLGTVSDS